MVTDKGRTWKEKNLSIFIQLGPGKSALNGSDWPQEGEEEESWKGTTAPDLMHTTIIASN